MFALCGEKKREREDDAARARESRARRRELRSAPLRWSMTLAGRGPPARVVVGVEQRRRGLPEQRHVRAVPLRRQRAERHGHRRVGGHHLPVAPVLRQRPRVVPAGGVEGGGVEGVGGVGSGWGSGLACGTVGGRRQMGGMIRGRRRQNGGRGGAGEDTGPEPPTEAPPAAKTTARSRQARRGLLPSYA